MMAPLSETEKDRVGKPIRDLALAARQRLLPGTAQGCITPDAAFLTRHGLTALFETAAGGKPANAANRLQNTVHCLALEGIHRTFEEKGIACLALKGAGIARLLYPDVHMRQARDIDILVRPEQFSFAVTQLTASGWSLITPHHPVDSAMFSLAARVIKDAALVHNGLGLLLELHQRLVFSPGLDRRLRSCHPDLSPRLTKRGEIPYPLEVAGLLHYLLCHGAISVWTRLKWLLDVWLLVPKLSNAQWRELKEASQKCRTESSVKAGLLLLCEVFETELPAEVTRWIQEGQKEPAVMQRYRYYLQHLQMPEPREVVLNHRKEAYRSAALVCDGFVHRAEITFWGAVSSGLRNIKI